MNSSRHSIQPGAAGITFAGERLQLLPRRGVWWPAEEALLIADPHLGKAATFRAAGLPVPDTTASDLDRLDSMIEATHCARLIILGDLLHHRRGVSPDLVHSVAEWRRKRSSLEITLVRGNHDDAAGDPPAEWGIQQIVGSLVIEPFRLTHFPNWTDSQPTIAGHLHPKFRLRHGAEDLRLPGFLLKGQTLVLPAFGEFVDGQLVTERPHQIYVIAGNEVLELSC